MAISQEKLAERAGLHRTYVSDIERGARNVSLESIKRLALALEVSIPALFSHAGVPAGEALQPDELVEILFVEDEVKDVELTMEALKSAGFFNRIFVARDGEEALDFLFCKGKFSHRRPDDRPQLILLDLKLPKIDGLEVLRRVKGDPRTQSIPVVVLTISEDDGDATETRRLGADAYITKPVGFHSLTEVAPQLCLRWALLKSSPAGK